MIGWRLRADTLPEHNVRDPSQPCREAGALRRLRRLCPRLRLRPRRHARRRGPRDRPFQRDEGGARLPRAQAPARRRPRQEQVLRHQLHRHLPPLRPVQARASLHRRPGGRRLHRRRLPRGDGPGRQDRRPRRVLVRVPDVRGIHRRARQQSRHRARGGAPRRGGLLRRAGHDRALPDAQRACGPRQAQRVDAHPRHRLRHVPVGGADGQAPRVQGDRHVLRVQTRHRQGHRRGRAHRVQGGARNLVRGLHLRRPRAQGDGDHRRRGREGGHRRHRPRHLGDIHRGAREARNLRLLRQRVRRRARVPAAQVHQQVRLPHQAQA
mmetsp:Transcript_6809/g.29773  ORF Transcript_6809/g.29773 Transcript_6809/m.29773 type:complete len:323 (+) Transcript_6809:29-997(+)